MIPSRWLKFIRTHGFVLFPRFNKHSPQTLTTAPHSKMTAAWPWLPTELVERIVGDIWDSSLSTVDRDKLSSTLPLVNSTWLDAFIRISSQNVHISSSAQAQQFLRSLREEFVAIPRAIKNSPDSLCHSITFRIESGVGEHPVPQIFLYSLHNPMGDTLTSLLYNVDSLDYLPNLRRISIEYVDWGYDDLFDHHRLAVFPDQVEELDISWTFNGQACNSPHKMFKGRYLRHSCGHMSLPGVKKLRLHGASAQTVKDLVSICPNLKEVETDLAVGLEIRSSLPATVDTLWFRILPGVIISARQFDEL
ncbi:hypothetical protein SERLA73DRAFT_184592 [Serpula lacrymans var. lacrymans S7.3]|uniref:F-box domain-containing protein n=2 Tax=Serpula lacrymans var. lacrymans TaxID=341189 RepID=F8Q4P2_SERL3|nr:uncharacterized protein SERLADRAFT_472360 [Serpula lacrymans var. lacrymans S7.9]EGN96519.1 hypothetical protein SERLA73DRAFT_184592 [Serpula lacrymans var. lacrymans S7.3]EGO22064.1 hypothetical protein SERLADRAFT_472360 [Serpula lacrymans var. lacrymans S7.9]